MAKKKKKEKRSCRVFFFFREQLSFSSRHVRWEKLSSAALFLPFSISSVTFLPLWLFVHDPGSFFFCGGAGNNNVVLRKVHRYKRRPRGGIHLSLWVNTISLQIVTLPLNWSRQFINPN